MFDADQPITDREQDRLNRSLFATYLARCLLDQKEPESFVVGLFGPSGSGKTSVIELVINELNYASGNMFDDEKPLILNLNLWDYSGRDNLIHPFFQSLLLKIEQDEFFSAKKEVLPLLKRYYQILIDKKSMPPLIKKYSPLWLSAKEATKPELGLMEIKTSINEELYKGRQKIIIILDNISRLYPVEVKEIFQLIKSIADFAQTIYLLALDKHHVLEQLNQMDADGVATLEKLIQLPFDIPPILSQDLEPILSDRLFDIVSNIKDDAWNHPYWVDLYHSSLKYFFHDVRDITRYVNIIQFSYPRLQDVVNPVDFFALTAIEVFIPDVYFGIRDNKDLFSDLLDQVYPFEETQMSDQMRVEEIIERNERIPRDYLIELFIKLFPRIRKLYRPTEVFYHSDTIAHKLKRLSSPDFFDAYFRLSMQPSDMSDREFSLILNLAEDKEAFDQALTRLNQDDRIPQFLSKLDSHVLDVLPVTFIPGILNGLIDNGDLFPEGRQQALTINTEMRIHRIIHALLRRFPSFETRFELMQNAIAYVSKSIYTSTHELREQEKEHREEEDTFLPQEYRDLTPPQLDALKKLCVLKIEEWANRQEMLIDHPKLLSILFAWKDFGGERNCQRFVEKITKMDRGLIAFLMAALAVPIDQAMTRYVKTILWEKYLDNINAFIPAKRLEAHAKTLFEDEYFEKLREKEQLALMIFLDLLNARTNKIIPKTTV